MIIDKIIIYKCNYLPLVKNWKNLPIGPKTNEQTYPNTSLED